MSNDILKDIVNNYQPLANTNSICIKEFNKYLDIVLIWISLYFWTHQIIVLGMVFISLGISTYIMILCFYNISLETCECKKCHDKDFKKYLINKPQKISIENLYWKSEQRGSETSEQTKNRILEEREKHYIKKAENNKDMKNRILDFFF